MKESTTDSTQVLKLTLRIRSVDDEHTADKHAVLASRNTQNDLHDIKFDFNKATETVHDVVSEMVSASLIDERDAQLGMSRFFHHHRRSSSFHSSLFFNDETRRKSSTCHSDICSRSFIAGIARTLHSLAFFLSPRNPTSIPAKLPTINYSLALLNFH